MPEEWAAQPFYRRLPSGIISSRLSLNNIPHFTIQKHCVFISSTWYRTNMYPVSLHPHISTQWYVFLCSHLLYIKIYVDKYTVSLYRLLVMYHFYNSPLHIFSSVSQYFHFRPINSLPVHLYTCMHIIIHGSALWVFFSAYLYINVSPVVVSAIFVFPSHKKQCIYVK
jgi:hypothetical protein